MRYKVFSIKLYDRLIYVGAESVEDLMKNYSKFLPETEYDSSTICDLLYNESGVPVARELEEEYTKIPYTILLSLPLEIED